jgi:5-methylcytosine-specific restriction protein A
MPGYVGPPNFRRAVKIQRRAWTDRYGEDWKQRSLELRQASGMCCARCNTKGSVANPIQSHHIVPLAKGGSNNKMNLKSLCQSCHNKEHRRLGVKRP